MPPPSHISLSYLVVLISSFDRVTSFSSARLPGLYKGFFFIVRSAQRGSIQLFGFARELRIFNEHQHWCRSLQQRIHITILRRCCCGCWLSPPESRRHVEWWWERWHLQWAQQRRCACRSPETRHRSHLQVGRADKFMLRKVICRSTFLQPSAFPAGFAGFRKVRASHLYLEGTRSTWWRRLLVGKFPRRFGSVCETGEDCFAKSDKCHTPMPKIPKIVGRAPGPDYSRDLRNRAFSPHRREFSSEKEVKTDLLWSKPASEAPIKSSTCDIAPLKQNFVGTSLLWAQFKFPTSVP